MCVYLFYFQREEIICCLAELLTEKKDEILSANKRDMELATVSGTEAQRRRTDHAAACSRLTQMSCFASVYYSSVAFPLRGNWHMKVGIVCLSALVGMCLSSGVHQPCSQSEGLAGIILCPCDKEIFSLHESILHRQSCYSFILFPHRSFFPVSDQPPESVNC